MGITKGRNVKRWIATCAVVMHEDRRSTLTCGFNDRAAPERHTTSDAATRESIRHLISQHDLHGAREVTVRRVYKPRELEREEIVE